MCELGGCAGQSVGYVRARARIWRCVRVGVRPLSNLLHLALVRECQTSSRSVAMFCAGACVGGASKQAGKHRGSHVSNTSIYYARVLCRSIGHFRFLCDRTRARAGGFVWASIWVWCKPVARSLMAHARTHAKLAGELLHNSCDSTSKLHAVAVVVSSIDADRQVIGTTTTSASLADAMCWLAGWLALAHSH